MIALIVASVWSWGIIAWELLGGYHPFPDADPATTMYRIANNDLGSVLVANPRCPRTLAAVVDRAVRRSRQDRYGSFEDIIFDLQPTHREIQRRQADQIVIEAREKLLDGRAEEALQHLRRALELDPDHAEIRELRGKIQHEVSLRSVRAQVEGLMGVAQKAASERQFAVAVEHAEKALKLSADDSGITEFLRNARISQERLQRSAALIQQARQEIAASQLSRAFRFAEEAKQLDPEDTTVSQILAEIQGQLQARQAERELDAVITNAKRLIAFEELEEAMAALTSLTPPLGQQPEIIRLLAEAREKQRISQQAGEAQRQLENALGEMANGNFDLAIRVLQALVASGLEPKFRVQVDEILSRARRGKLTKERDLRVSDITARARALMGHHSWDAAIKVLEAGQADWPGEDSIAQTLEEAVNERNLDLKSRSIERVAAKTEKLKDRSQLNEAATILNAAIAELGEDPRLVQLRERLNAQLATDQRNKPQPAPPDPVSSRTGRLHSVKPNEGRMENKPALSRSKKYAILGCGAGIVLAGVGYLVFIASGTSQKPVSVLPKVIVQTPDPIFTIKKGEPPPVDDAIPVPRAAADGKQAQPAQSLKEALQLSAYSVFWSGNSGASLPNAVVQVRSTRPELLQIRVPREANGWLKVTPLTATSGSPIRLALASWPSPGRYATSVDVYATNSPAIRQSIRVNLEVLSPAPLTAPPRDNPTDTSQQSPNQPTPKQPVPSSPPSTKAEPPSGPVLWGGRTSGRLVWTGVLPPNGVVVLGQNGLIDGPGSATGYGPPSAVPTRVVEVTPGGLQLTPKTVDRNPAGIIEIRNTTASPIGLIQVRWELQTKP